MTGKDMSFPKKLFAPVLLLLVSTTSCPAPVTGQTATVDFAIDSATIEPAALYSNTRPRLVVKVKNVGADAVDGAQLVVNFSTTSGGQQSNVRFQGSSLSPARVAAGEVVTLVAELYQAVSMPAGSYQVTATLTLGGSAYGRETNTANNQKAIQFQVNAGRAPGSNGDLAIVSHALQDQGTYHNLVVDLKNQGTDSLTCPWPVELQAKIMSGARQAFQGSQVVYSSGAPMAPGVGKQFTFRVVDRDTNQRLANGTYQLQLSAWRDTTICQETTFDNNFKNVELVLGAPSAPVAVDFAIDSLTVEPAALYDNTRPRLVVKVKNVGADAVDGAQLVVNFSTTSGGQRSTVQFGGVSLNPARVAAGGVVTLSGDLYNAVSLPAGSYQVTATMTAGGSAYGRDTNTANNEKTIQFQVNAGRAPGSNGDLAIVSHALQDQGTYHNLVVDLKNQGTDPLTCPWPVELQAKIMSGARQAFQGSQVVYSSGAPMAPGVAKQFTFRVVDRGTNQRLANGTYQLQLSAWRDTTICQETTFDNNFKNVDVVVGASAPRAPISAPTRIPVKPAPGIEMKKRAP